MQAPEAKDEEILLAHTSSYLEKLIKGTLSDREILILELPYSLELVKASRTCVGGTIKAAEIASQKRSVCVHLGGGFHHAFSDHGEGFCVLNDVACAAYLALKRHYAEKIMVIDCDLHQGNGTAAIFSDTKSVFTFSIHQENNYPVLKPPSDLDLGLSDGVSDQEYLSLLETELPAVIERFNPDLIFYVAGADPYADDQLGGLNLSLEGLKKRDEYVLRLAQIRGIAVVIVLGGGYARDVDDTVTIHFNTAKIAQEVFS